MKKFSSISLETPIGYLIIRGDEKAVHEISFNDDNQNEEGLSNPILAQCKSQLEAYFKKDRSTFNFPILPKGTNFQEEVWQKLLEIPYGKTISYKQLANNLGNIKKIRAAASANGKNPLAIVIPCHRVIGADGSMTGYASGVWRKRWLLEHENAISKKPDQLSLF